MSIRVLHFVRVAVFMFALSAMAQDASTPRLTLDDLEQIESAIARLRACQTEQERSEVNEIEVRCYFVLFMRGDGGSVSRKALSWLENRRATAFLVKALAHESVDQKIKVIRCLARLRQYEAVPALLEQLKKHNYVVVEGSSEVVQSHKTLKRELVDALTKLTGLSLSCADIDDTNELDGVVEKVQVWIDSLKHDKQKERE